MKIQAEQVLQRLVADRDRIEQCLDEAGRQDALKGVTGYSSLDSAIASTTRIIKALDTAGTPRVPLTHVVNGRHRTSREIAIEMKTLQEQLASP